MTLLSIYFCSDKNFNSIDKEQEMQGKGNENDYLNSQIDCKRLL